MDLLTALRMMRVRSKACPQRLQTSASARASFWQYIQRFVSISAFQEGGTEQQRFTVPSPILLKSLYNDNDTCLLISIAGNVLPLQE